MDFSANRFRFLVNELTGMDLVKFSGQHTLRAHLSKLIERYEISQVLDVGANEGGFGCLLRSIGYRGSIHSFEPVSAAFHTLALAAKRDPGWYVHQFALGSESGVATINVSKYSQMSSFLPASRYGSENWPNLETESTEEVNVLTLDDCFASGLISRGVRTMLKMDTQGFDLEVFKGASTVRSQIACLLSELSLLPVYEGMPDFGESLATYRAAGFVASGFYPITRNRSFGLNEVDCVLVDPSVLTPGS